MPGDPLNGEKTKKRKKQKGPPRAPPSAQIEPITSVENEDYTQFATTVNQTATISNHHTSTTQSLTNLDQISLVMNGTSSKHFNVPHQASDDPSSMVQKKQSKRHRSRTKPPKQSRRKKTSKSRTRKERQSKTQPPSKKLLHLRPSQQSSSPTKRSALRTPATPYASKHLRSRAVSQQESLTSQEVLNSKHVIKSKVNRSEREFSLPPVFQHSPAHLSSSLHRLLSSTSSNFSSSISSSSSIEKDSMVSHSRIWH